MNCNCIAKTTGIQCKNKAKQGLQYCYLHIQCIDPVQSQNPEMPVVLNPVPNPNPVPVLVPVQELKAENVKSQNPEMPIVHIPVPVVVENINADEIPKPKLYRSEDIIINEKIGAGTYGEVSLGTLREDPSKQIIIKLYKSYSPTPNNFLQGVEDFYKENILIQYLNKLATSIIKFYGILYDHENDKLYVVLEKFGDSIDKTIISTKKKYTQKEYYKIFKNILQALADIHCCGIFHSDLKPANILIDDNLNIKIIDYGISNYLGIGPTLDVIKTYICTESYKAKDLRKSYQSDSFGIGQVLYNILVRTYYFIKISNDNPLELLDGDIIVNKFIDSRAGKHASDLLRKLIDPNISSRITALDALKHPYFTDNIDLHGGKFFYDNNGTYDVTYSRDDYLEHRFELAYAEQIIDRIKSLKIAFKQIGERVKILNTSYMYALDVPDLSENNIFNTLIKIRQLPSDQDVTDQLVYSILHAYGTVDSIFNNVSIIYVSKKHIYDIHQFLFKHPSFEYYPIWTLISYFKVVCEYNYDYMLDINYFYNMAVLFIVGIDEDIDISLWDLSVFILNKQKSGIYSIPDNVNHQLNKIEKSIFDNPYIYIKLKDRLFKR